MKYGTVRSAARALQINHVTLLRVLRREGIEINSHAKATSTGKKRSPHTGSFARWLKANEGMLLPRDFDKLKKLSGCTKDSIACYFYRRRKSIKDELKTVPDLRTNPVILVDSFEERYDSGDFKHYEYLIDKFSLKVSILARLEDNTTLYFEVPDVYKFKRAVMGSQEDRQQESSSSQEKPSSSHHSEDTPRISSRNEVGYFPATFQDSLRKDLPPSNDESD